jgi:phage baseplate assembly protein V
VISEALENLSNRMRMLVGRGRITTSNDTGNVQTHQVKTGALETGDARMRIAEFGFSSMPPVDSDAVMLFLTGERTAGLIIGTAHQASRPRGLAAGETIIYSVDGKHVLIANDRIEVQANGQPVNVLGASTVRIEASQEIYCDTPMLKCTGDILDNCNTQPNTAAGMRQIFNTHTHNVTGILTGGAQVVSQVPNQLQRIAANDPQAEPPAEPA